MLEWIDVADSKRIISMAYDFEDEIIVVRFPSGKEWQYANCPLMVWEEFSSPTTSKGTYIREQLNGHAHGPWLG